MKRNILYIMIAISGLSACKKESLSKYEIEKSFTDPAVKFEDFKKALADGTDGFRMIIEPTTTSGLIGGYIKFETATSAKIVLDNSRTNAKTPFSNGYSVKVAQTNSVLGLGGASAFAVSARAITGVDTTFTYKYTSGDTLKLVGDLLGTKMSLIKVSKTAGDEYLAGKMDDMITNVNNIMLFPRYFKRITVGAKSYDITFSPSAKTAFFNYGEGSVHKTFSTAYSYTNNGVEFKKPLIDGVNTIASLNNMVINTSAHSGTLTAGTITAALTNELAPSHLDQTLAGTFIKTPPQGNYSENYSGFTISGVEDALGVTSIPSFYSIDFYPVIGANPYGGFRFYLTTAYFAYYPAFTNTITADGKLIFTLLGYAGTATTADTRTVIRNTAAILSQPEGFYVIAGLSDTGSATYDLVNVKDATSWITFQ